MMDDSRDFVWIKQLKNTRKGVCVAFNTSYAVASQKMCNMLHKKKGAEAPL